MDQTIQNILHFRAVGVKHLYFSFELKQHQLGKISYQIF